MDAIKKKLTPETIQWGFVERMVSILVFGDRN